MTKLSAKLPSSHGLDWISEDLVDHPLGAHLVVGLVDCSATTTKHDTGEVTPTARFQAIEVLDGPARDAALSALRSAFRARTGEDAMRIDPATGEILGA